MIIRPDNHNFFELENFAFLDDRLAKLANECRNKLVLQGFAVEQVKIKPFLHLRYKGTDCALMCSSSDEKSALDLMQYGDFMSAFLER